MSHIPVREALNSLAARGFITYQPSRGFFTRRLSSQELVDIYRWRRVLETEALRLAVPQITAADIAAMKSLLQDMSRKTSSEERLEYLELNREFHFVPFRRAGSDVLLHLLSYLWDVAAPYVASGMIKSSHSVHHHQEQLDLIERGDVERLIDAMDRHREYRVDLVARWEAPAGEQPAAAGDLAG